MSHDDLKISSVHLDSNKAQQLGAAQNEAMLEEIAQEESSQGMLEFIESGTFNPTLMTRTFQPLEVKVKKSPKEEDPDKAEKKDLDVVDIEQVEQITDEASKKNPELQARSLLLLRSQLSPNDSREEILRKVRDFYPDHSLADDTLDYLMKTTKGELNNQVRRAKEILNQTYGREIRAGKNIEQQAREFSQKGLGTPTGLRDLYREITGNPRDSQTLFAELSNKFDFKNMRAVLDFMFHSLGSDLKAKGPSIDRGELHRLMTEGRSMQAILGVYIFFRSRMNLIKNAFKNQGLPIPPRLNFELLAKLFVRFLQERYPSGDKILQMAEHLNLMEDILGQIIVYTQMRDAIRSIAPRLFKSEQHRQDVLTTFLDTIEELDEKLDEEEEES